jgi:hypothetical protein
MLNLAILSASLLAATSARFTSRDETSGAATQFSGRSVAYWSYYPTVNYTAGVEPRIDYFYTPANASNSTATPTWTPSQPWLSQEFEAVGDTIGWRFTDDPSEFVQAQVRAISSAFMIQMHC